MVQMNKKAYKKMLAMAEKIGNDEIGGLLLGKTVEYTDNTHGIEIDDAIILEQQKTGATIEISDEDMANFTKNATAKQLESVIGWWHSHGNGGLFWSSTDDDTSIRLANFMKGMCVSIVVTSHKKAKIRAKTRIDIKNDNKIITIDNVQLDIPDMHWKDRWFGNKLTKQQQKEIDQKVTTVKYPTPNINQEWKEYRKQFYDEDDCIYMGESITETCPTCKGTGETPRKNMCLSCEGVGIIERLTRKDEMQKQLDEGHQQFEKDNLEREWEEMKHENEDQLYYYN